MKILFVTENYFPIVSGVPVVVKYLAEGLHKKGYEVSIVTQKSGNTTKQEKINGITVFRFDIYRDWKHCYRGDIHAYIKFVKRYQADVYILECAECVTTDVLLPHIATLHGKILLHAHGLSGFDNRFFTLKDNIKHTLGSTYNWFNSKWYFNGIFKKSMNNIDAFVCLSEIDSGIDYIKKYAHRYYVLDNAADDMFFSQDIPNTALRKYIELKNKHYIVSCANYTVVKNQKDLIREYFLSESSRNYSLVCIGSQNNDYYQECRAIVSKLQQKIGIRDIHLLYNVQRMDIPSIIKNASLYVVTSRWEQYSISLIEAMSQGIPFISTDVGNARILPGGRTVSTVNEIHGQIDYLLGNKDDYLNYSAKGKEFAWKNCRINSVVDKFENIIKLCTQNSYPELVL